MLFIWFTERRAEYHSILACSERQSCWLLFSMQLSWESPLDAQTLQLDILIVKLFAHAGEGCVAPFVAAGIVAYNSHVASLGRYTAGCVNMCACAIQRLLQAAIQRLLKSPPPAVGAAPPPPGCLQRLEGFQGLSDVEEGPPSSGKGRHDPCVLPGPRRCCGRAAREQLPRGCRGANHFGPSGARAAPSQRRLPSGTASAKEGQSHSVTSRRAARQDGAFRDSKLEFWRQVAGIDMSALVPLAKAAVLRSCTHEGDRRARESSGANPEGSALGNAPPGHQQSRGLAAGRRTVCR